LRGREREVVAEPRGLETWTGPIIEKGVENLLLNFADSGILEAARSIPTATTSNGDSRYPLTLTTTVTSYTATTTPTTTSVVYTVTASPGRAGAAASWSPLAYIGFISLLAITVGHRLTASKGRKILTVRSVSTKLPSNPTFSREQEELLVLDLS
jgi:hypothetical protein